MYELKRLLSRHMEENAFKYFCVLCIFALGILLGFLCSHNVYEEMSEGLAGEIEEIINGFSEGIFDKYQILKTSFMKNLRFFILISLCGFSLWLIPVSLVAIVSFGFSIGFTVSYMSANFAGIGLAVSLLSLAFTFLISIPLYIILSVVAINHSRTKKHGRGECGFGAYVLVVLFLFLVSMISVVADAFAVPFFIGLICR